MTHFRVVHCEFSSEFCFNEGNKNINNNNEQNNNKYVNV